jgi:hypothetical protein
VRAGLTTFIGGPEGGDECHHRGGESGAARAGIEQMNGRTIHD